MLFNAACSKLPPIVLAIAQISLCACAMGGSDGAGAGVCPPVVQYDQAFRERAAAELELLPDASAIANLISDFYVLRQQCALFNITPRL